MGDWAHRSFVRPLTVPPATPRVPGAGASGTFVAPPSSSGGGLDWAKNGRPSELMPGTSGGQNAQRIMTRVPTPAEAREAGDEIRRFINTIDVYGAGHFDIQPNQQPWEDSAQLMSSGANAMLLGALVEGPYQALASVAAFINDPPGVLRSTLQSLEQPPMPTDALAAANNYYWQTTTDTMCRDFGICSFGAVIGTAGQRYMLSPIRSATRGPVTPRYFADSPDGIRLFEEAKVFRGQLPGLAASKQYRNIAVADVIVDGQRRTVRFANTPEISGKQLGIHSEERLIMWYDMMKNQQGRDVKVLSVFSDRIPCGTNRANCAGKLGDAFGQDLDVFFNILKGPIR